MRIIIDTQESDTFTKEIIQLSRANNNPIKLKYVEKLPYNLLIVDDREAIWGKTSYNDEDTPNFWTNDPTQIAILKMAFGNQWKKSSELRTPNKLSP